MADCTATTRHATGSSWASLHCEREAGHVGPHVTEDAGTVVAWLPGTTAAQQLPGRPGSWVAYYGDRSAIVPFDTELDALRHAVGRSMDVVFCPYGVDVLVAATAAAEAAR